MSPAKAATPAERLAMAERDIDKLNTLLEALWVQRSALHSAIVELKLIRRNVELARTSIERQTP